MKHKCNTQKCTHLKIMEQEMYTYMFEIACIVKLQHNKNLCCILYTSDISLCLYNL